MSVSPSSTGGDADTDPDTVTGMNPTAAQPLPVVTGTATLRLDDISVADRRAETSLLRTAPHGLRVELHIGALMPWDCPDCVHFIADAAVERSLTIDIHGYFDCVERWLSDLRGAIGYRIAHQPLPRRRRLNVVRPPRDPGGGAA